MVGKRSVAQTAKRLRHNPTIRRPKRNIPVKSIDDTVGLSKKEEKELKKALYASLQETKLKVTYAYETVVDGKVVSTSRNEPPPSVPAFEEPSPRIYVSSTAPSIDESSQDSVKSYNSSYTNTTSISEPIRTKVHAQRKFAQGSLPVTPSTTPVKSVTSPFKLLPKTAKTEDFLTFLCLRGTSVLPPHLDFLNFSREESGDSHSTSRTDTPAGSNSSKNTKAGEVTRESTPESSSVSSNDELQQLRTPSPSTRNSGINSALRKAARASAGTPETARGIVSLRQGLSRKVSSLAHTPSPQRTRRSLCTPEKTPTSRGSQTR
ncbi:protein Jumonji isoform X2 [Patella vulgata]|nr:protein Jumonji isoform X2 [Patella vulgata]